MHTNRKFFFPTFSHNPNMIPFCPKILPKLKNSYNDTSINIIKDVKENSNIIKIRKKLYILKLFNLI